MKSTRSKCSVKTTCARSLIWIASFEHRQRALSPDHPVLRGTAQNPDVFFQMRERANSYYDACPEIVQSVMNKFAEIVGRSYHLVDYVGAPDADRVIVMMGSGAEVAHEAVDHLNANGEKAWAAESAFVPPFPVQAFLEALPATVRKIAVLDRTKESGAIGEPLYLDVVNALHEGVKAGLQPAENCARSRVADATVSPPRNSRRQWSRRSTTI